MPQNINMSTKCTQDVIIIQSLLSETILIFEDMVEFLSLLILSYSKAALVHLTLAKPSPAGATRRVSWTR